MTPQESIETMKVAIADVEWNYPMDYAIAFEIAISAIEKQIPKKPITDFSTCPIYDKDYNYLEQLDLTKLKCPVCNHVIANGEIDKTDCAEIHYCNNCGQALDWSDEK